MPTSKDQQWDLALQSDSTEKRVDALRKISANESVTGITTRVIGLAADPDDDVRMWAAEALERSVSPQTSEIPALVDQLQSSVDGEISYWSATMLGRLGFEASEVDTAKALRHCLDESLYLPARERAAWALCQIGDAASVAKESLKKAAETAPPRLKQLAAEALRRLTDAA